MNELNVLQRVATQASIELMQGTKSMTSDKAMTGRMRRIAENLIQTVDEWEEEEGLK